MRENIEICSQKEVTSLSELLDMLDQLGFLFVPVLFESFILSSDPYYIMQTQ